MNACHLLRTASAPWSILPSYLLSIMFSSVTQSCQTLCNPMDCSMPGFPSFTNSWSLLKLMSIESVMPSNHLVLCHPLLLLPSVFPSIWGFPSESALGSNGQSIAVTASMLPVNIQGWFPSWLTGWVSMQSNGLWRVFSSATIQKHQFFSTQPSLWSNSHIHT